MRQSRVVLPLVALSLAMTAAGSVGCVESEAPAGELAALSSRDPKLWQVKMIGTHNSYSKEDFTGPDHKYRLGEQLEWGVRVLELDVVSAAGDVSHAGNPAAKRHCSKIESCLDQVATWSKAHPYHSPIVIYVEMSDDFINDALGAQPDYAGYYAAIAAAWKKKIPRAQQLSVKEGLRPISALKNKIALVVYRKRGKWAPISSKVKALAKGYSAADRIFLAGKNPNQDGDLKRNGHLYFVKADNPEPSWTRGWWAKPVFIAANVCKHNDCREEKGDKARMQLAFTRTIVNAVLTNEMDDVGAWLQPPASSIGWLPNLTRLPGQKPWRNPGTACFYRDPDLNKMMFCLDTVHTFGSLGGGNDAISSVEIRGNAKVLLFKDPGFNFGDYKRPSGDHRLLIRTIMSLADMKTLDGKPFGFNDHTSSLAVVPYK